MRRTYLEVTFRRGKMLAAYLYLPRAPGVKSSRTEAISPGLLVDYSSSGDVIGLEITAPGQVSVGQIQTALEQLGQIEIDPRELAPLAGTLPAA